MARPLAGRSRLIWAVAGVVAVGALVLVGLVFGGQEERSPRSTSPTTGQALPIELPNLTGEGTVSLAQFAGRPVVVNFFASWCTPCLRELPAFQAVSSRTGDRVAFLAVNHQDNRQAGLDMLRQAGVRYPAGYDPDGQVAVRYGLFGMPTTLFISADGRLLEKHTGEMSRAQLEQAIDRHFG
jgi:cytochrome c biogenesis protein CcmG/thiol:disulfide interchange protein DsbE